MRALARIAALALVVTATVTFDASSQTRERLTLRGHDQQLYLYGPPNGEPIIVSSGDGGWIHLGPDVARFLAGRGYFVMGVDVRAYLSSFTSSQSTLDVREEPHDFRVLADFAQHRTGRRPILIGVSEGAGLSVLAATDPGVKPAIAGVVALGLPDINELGWRWKDAVIYLTHKTPSEPTFSTSAIIGKVAPVPIIAIHSTHDEFVSVAEVTRVMASAMQPKRLVTIEASNHRFSGSEDELHARLLDAIAWVKQHAPH